MFMKNHSKLILPASRMGRLAGLILAAAMSNAFAAGPWPDFGDGGMVATPLAPANGMISDMAVQGDGKILVVGRLETAAGRDWLIRRYLPDGAVDTAFGERGAVATDFGAADEEALAVRALPDGKILVAGTSIAAGGTAAHGRYAVARYNPDGTPDSGFGDGGQVLAEFINTDYAHASGLLPLPDGRYLIAGMMHYDQPDGSTADPDADVMLTRLNGDGGIDRSFGVDGWAYALFGLAREEALGAVLQADGKILVHGYQDQGGRNAGFVARFNPDGSVDADFADHGIALDSSAARNSAIHALALQADGRIVAVGTQGASPAAQCFATRYLPDGSPDSAFGVAGVAALDSGRDETCRAVAVSPDGKLLLGGTSGADMAVYRLNGDGSRDGGFGPGGRRTIRFEDGTSRGAALALIGPDALLVAGDVALPGGGGIGLAKWRLSGDDGSDGDDGSEGGDSGIAGPDPFAFAEKKKVKRRALVKSNSVAIRGLDRPAAIAVENGEYSIGCRRQAFTRSPGLIDNGQKVCVRHRAASQARGTTEAQLTVGKVTAVFRSATR
jgi:uncharacterized delta-60 repeat protein